MTAHVHAALMAEYAKDAAETEAPWERWECRQARGDELYVHPERAEWRPASNWQNGDPHPSWNPDWDFRRKPAPLECWANVYAGATIQYDTKEDAIKWGQPNSYGDVLRVAVHMREVIE